MSVHPAEPRDRIDIRAVHLAAFPTPAEADLVEALVRDGDAILSLVHQSDGRIDGHVLMSRMTVSADGREYRALGLAPVAVLPERQGVGIGSALIRAALDRAESAGEDLAFVVGDPGYYARFGFSAEEALPFASPYAGPHFMARTLRPAALPPRAGKAAYAPAFAALEN